MSKRGQRTLFAFKFETSTKSKNEDEVHSKDIYSSFIDVDKQAKQLPVICKVIMMTLSHRRLFHNFFSIPLVISGMEKKFMKLSLSLSSTISRHLHGHKLHEKYVVDDTLPYDASKVK